MLDVFLSSQDTMSTTQAERDVIGIKGMTFSWNASTVSGTPAPNAHKRDFKLHIDGEVIFRLGGFNLIVGPTGSGKTSLLMSLLGRSMENPACYCSAERPRRRDASHRYAARLILRLSARGRRCLSRTGIMDPE